MNRILKFRAWDGYEMIYNDLFIRASGNPPIYQGEERDDLIVMQYIGLKDKNSKEVYEGDLVKSLTGSNCSQVVWRNNGWELNIRDGMGYTTIDSGDEIIGNVYENPELLQNHDKK